ncbi:transcriptional regulator [Neorhizobium sp. SOG26]|uniref:ChrR family anti-sigma-E factor n=1 Tax=Neorhizobium sp. SOG26 TaxID=2060726 RepID=UPI000E577C8D|nr:ChrR family anti-sigma-E factor [Neorhizobium sp. SOG26]AXV15240.1 transcriptional regulator [Neorhizobium sp. SOG26]
MQLNLERLDFLIAQHVAGSLPEPASVLVGAHLEMQETSRRLAGSFEMLAGEALEASEGEPIILREKRLEEIFASPTITIAAEPERKVGTRFPSALWRYAGCDLPEVPWKTRLPGFKQHTIERTEEAEASLLWVRPGRALPHHAHHGLELTLVLEGEFHDHRGSFAAGAVSVADESVEHRPVAGTECPCVCFSILFAPIALSGSPLRRLGDIIGL